MSKKIDIPIGSLWSYAYSQEDDIVCIVVDVEKTRVMIHWLSNHRAVISHVPIWTHIKWFHDGVIKRIDG